MFANLLHEHNADHSAESGEGEVPPGALPPGEPIAPAERGPVPLRADTASISARAAAEVLGAGGRTAGENSVQQARLAAAPTFVRPAPKADGVPVAAEDAAEEQGAGKEHGKYGRQLARFETMIQQNSKHRNGKKALKVSDTPPCLCCERAEPGCAQNRCGLSCCCQHVGPCAERQLPGCWTSRPPLHCFCPCSLAGVCAASPLQEAKKAAAAASSKLAASKSGKLIVKEDQEEGQVTGKVYWQYIVAYGVFSFVALILLWSSEQVGEAESGGLIGLFGACCI